MAGAALTCGVPRVKLHPVTTMRRARFGAVEFGSLGSQCRANDVEPSTTDETFVNNSDVPLAMPPTIAMPQRSAATSVNSSVAPSLMLPSMTIDCATTFVMDRLGAGPAGSAPTTVMLSDGRCRFWMLWAAEPTAVMFHTSAAHRLPGPAAATHSSSSATKPSAAASHRDGKRRIVMLLLFSLRFFVVCMYVVSPVRFERSSCDCFRSNHPMSNHDTSATIGILPSHTITVVALLCNVG